jgi:signal transduction histidine kinase/CheY-like chemotaxis protein
MAPPPAATCSQPLQPGATEHHERVRAYEIAAYVAPCTRPVSRFAADNGPSRYLSAASFPFDIAPGPPVVPAPSNDLTLNALVQHGAHTLDCDRAFLSLIDNRSQFICAEMTRQQPLARQNPERPLLLGTSRIPLEWGVCPYTMSVFHGKTDVLPPNPFIVADPSYFYIKDFREVPSFAVRPYVLGYPKMVSYIEVPLRSLSGHILGSYCVVDDRLRDFAAPASLEKIREATAAISSYLDMKRLELNRIRSVRMMDSLNQFIASEKSSHINHNGIESGNDPAGPFDLDVFRSSSSLGPDQTTRPKQSLDSTDKSPTSQDGTGDERPLGPNPLFDTAVDGAWSPSSHPSKEAAFTTIRHDSLVKNSKDKPPVADSQEQHVPEPLKPSPSSPTDYLFQRAAKTIGFALDVDGLVFFDTVRSSALRSGSHESPSSIAEDRSASTTHVHDMASDILSEYRSDGLAGAQLVSRPNQSLIQRLTTRYPQGHVFVTDEYGVMNYEADHQDDADQQTNNNAIAYNDQKEILACVPKARYAIFLPLWHYQRESCFATCLVWVSDTAKSLDAGDVNSLTAFGNSLMVEILRLEALANAQSKSDFISSISHELRSPLHGIMATTELMQEATHDPSLLSMMDMIESCTATLLDTFDHLLAFARVNSRAQGTSPEDSKTLKKNSVRGKRANLDLGDVLEDMIEVVSLGHSHSLQRDSGLKGEQQHEPFSRNSLIPLNSVLVTTNIERNCDWKLPLDIGAWKRIILNLFSNALKYTDSGYVNVELKMVRPDDGSRYITFSVADTGIGMSREFAKYHMFTAFKQENNLSPGTGLGLSLVKNIVDSLGGKITVQSRQHEGTRFDIDIPIDEDIETSSVPIGEQTSSACNTLSGLSLGLMSIAFPSSKATSRDVPLIVSPLDVLQKSVCGICRQFLDVVVVEPSADTTPKLDIVMLDAIQITPMEHINWAQFLSKTFPDRNLPAVVVLGPTIKELEQCPGMKKVTYIKSPVTGRKLRAALLDAQDVWGSPPAPGLQDLSNRMDKIALQHPPTDALFKPTPMEDYNLPSSPSLISTQDWMPHQLPRSKTGSSSTISSRFSRFLLVDDNPINLKVLAAFITRLKEPFSVASDGAEAVQRYRDAILRDEKPYDCIFMDISMPVMDGFQAIAGIRQFEQQMLNSEKNGSRGSSHRSYILALTGLGSEEARRAARDSGVDGFLLKPVKFRDIMPLIG